MSEEGKGGPLLSRPLLSRACLFESLLVEARQRAELADSVEETPGALIPRALVSAA